MNALVAEVAKLMAQWLVEILFTWTGEIILFAVTLGRHKSRWDLCTNAPPGEFVFFSEVSAWIGMIFWFGVGFLTFLLLKN